MINRQKRSITLSEVKPVENISKNQLSRDKCHAIVCKSKDEYHKQLAKKLTQKPVLKHTGPF